MKLKKFKAYEKKAYRTVYSETEGSFHDDKIKQLAEEFLPKMMPSLNAKVVDIGCGPGIFMQAAQHLGYKNLTGVTLSKNDQKICKSKGFQTLLCSMSDLKFKDGEVDVIWCRHALEHSPYPLFTLFEFHRILNDVGRIYIEVPAPDNPRAFMHEYNPNHYSIFGERMWDALFEKSGFDLCDFLYYNQPVSIGESIADEKNFIFILKKSEETIESKFLRKYELVVEPD